MPFGANVELSPPNWSRTGNEKLRLPGEHGDGRLQLTLPVQKCGFSIRLFELARPLYHMRQRELAFASLGHAPIAPVIQLRRFANGAPLPLRLMPCAAEPQGITDCGG